MDSPRIVSDRLELVAATLDHVLAEIQAPERLASLLDADVGSGWPPGEYDRGAQEFFRDRLREGGEDAVGWYCWYAVRRGDSGEPSILVGAGGYIGPPHGDAAVEIGYSILPQWRSMGYATEMVEMLVANALADSRVCTIIANTSRDNPASCRVLKKAGFRDAGGQNGNDVRFEFLRGNGWAAR
jgi:[ribosomal protein S5]-alanine N-acetyltransferase